MKETEASFCEPNWSMCFVKNTSFFGIKNWSMCFKIFIWQVQYNSIAIELNSLLQGWVLPLFNRWVKRFTSTGCPTGTDIKFKMNARPQDHFHTSHIWQNLPYTCTFWICICKNFEAFPIFFKIGRNFDAHILKTAKIHRKLKIKQTSVLFYKYFLNESSDLYEIWDFYSWGSKELSNDFS